MYLIHANKQEVDAFVNFTGLYAKVETEFPLFELSLLKIEPLKSPESKILHVKYRYSRRNNV